MEVGGEKMNGLLEPFQSLEGGRVAQIEKDLPSLVPGEIRKRRDFRGLAAFRFFHS